MASKGEWPELSWDVAPRKLPWLEERVRFVARRARAFELAVEALVAEGVVALRPLAEALDRWDRVAAAAYLELALADGRRVLPEDVPTHAEELAKIYRSLQAARTRVLGNVERSHARRLVAVEGGLEPDDAKLRERAPPLPTSTGAHAPPTAPTPAPRPLSVDELRHRTDAEHRAFPTPTTLDAVLSVQPAPWIQAVFDTLGLELLDASDDDDDATVAARSALHRRAICRALPGPLLRDVVFTLGEHERALLFELVRAGGTVRYADASTRFGSDASDGFFWGERPPSGVVARVRRAGLCYVGLLEERQVLLLPEDLVDKVRALLEGDAGDDDATTHA